MITRPVLVKLLGTRAGAVSRGSWRAAERPPPNQASSDFAALASDLVSSKTRLRTRESVMR